MLSEKQFITTDIKQNDAFKQQLANMARGDAHHDLDEVFKRANYEKNGEIKAAFDAGIPSQPTTYYDEPGCLGSVIVEVVGITGNDKVENLKKVRNVTNDADNELEPTLVKVGLNSDTYFNYDVVQFIIECSTNTKVNPKLEPYDGKNFGNDFFERVSLGGITGKDLGTNASIIVDFSQHHFMEKLGQGTRSDNSIYYLMTPEVVNDPAGKTNIHNKSVFENQNGVKLVSCLQNTPNPMSYTKYNPFETNPLNNFFSNYDFSLLPIKQVFTSVKNEKLISTLNINYDRGSNAPFTDTIEDSKGENSITTVIGYLRSIIQKLTKNTFGGTSNDVNKKDNLQFNFNSKVQQKRGGDWFQALSCLDAKNRTYTQILPGNTRQQIDNSVLGPVYFVTHDQIAVSYALLNGANVIYMDYYGRIYVFKNRGDPIFAEGAIPIEELLFKSMRNYWIGENREYEQLKNDCINVYNNYKTQRVSLINTHKELLESTIKSLNSNNNLDLNNTNFTKIFTQGFKNLFYQAVTLAFVLDNFAEIFIDSDNFISEYDELLKDKSINIQENKERIIKLNTNLNILKGLYDKFGIISNDSGLIFSNWIVSNVKKIDVYKAVDKLNFDEYFEDNDSISKRFINLVFKPESLNANKTTDKHIFLPYIQTLPYEQSNVIVNALMNIKTKLDNTNTIKNTKTQRTSRSGRPGPETIFLNNLLNLIYEATLLLKKPVDNSVLVNASQDNVNINQLKKDIEAVGMLQSTDNIIVYEDREEIKILQGENGKESTSAMFVDDDPNKTGGGWKNLKTNSRGENVICDVSVKQITWQLLNCILLENCSLPGLKDILDSYKKYIPDVQPTGENIDYFDQDEFVQKILKHVKNEEEERYRNALIMNLGIVGLLLHIISILVIMNQTKHGGGNPDEPNDNVLQNFNMGYHPLMPIYMLLSPFYYTLGPKAQGDPFFYTYFTYFNVLEKMVDVLENNYLNESSNNSKVLSSYVIGFALRSLLFTSNTSSLQSKKILEVVDIPQEDFSTFSLKNDSFSNLIMGTFHSNPEEDIAAFILLDSDLFNNFINKEVNIKNILQQGTQIDNLPTYNVLKDKIYNLLSRIVSKINIDRGTPENNMEYLQTPPSQSSDNNVNNDAIAKGIPGLSTQERLQRIEEQQKQSLLNPKPALESDTLRPFDPSRQKTALDVSTFSNGDSSNMVTSNLSTNVGNIGRGGKTKKNRKKQTKRKTNKKHNKKDNKKPKNITRRHRKKKHNKKTKTNTKRFKKQ
jgi:hypothetical protein